ncbi:hypothetical protein J6590_027435 [Homalodisca vitripennis]|nr:hypothetical protein J6590_027435 [Homalodisca vitripennis]
MAGTHCEVHYALPFLTGSSYSDANLLFYYDSESCNRPSGVLLLEGCYCERLIASGTGSKNKDIADNKIEVQQRTMSESRLSTRYNGACSSYICQPSFISEVPSVLNLRDTCSGYKGYRTITRSSDDERGRVTAKRSCPCKQPVCPAIGGGSEVNFKPVVPRLCGLLSPNFA